MKTKNIHAILMEVWRRLQSSGSMKTNNIKIDTINAQFLLLNHKNVKDDLDQMFTNVSTKEKHEYTSINLWNPQIVLST